MTKVVGVFLRRIFVAFRCANFCSDPTRHRLNPPASQIESIFILWNFTILGHQIFKMWRPIFKMWFKKIGKKVSKSLLQIFSLTDELSESFGITKFVIVSFEKSELKQHHRMNIDSICDAGGFNLWRAGSEKKLAHRKATKILRKKTPNFLSNSF